MVHIKITYPQGAVQNIEAPNGTTIQIESSNGIIVKNSYLDVVKMTPSEFENMINTATWAIVTAENPNGILLSEEQNSSLMVRAERYLKSKGFNNFFSVLGNYGGDSEKSFFVPGMDMKSALHFIRIFNQVCAATDKCMLYSDGKFDLRVKQNTIFTDPKSDYTVVNLNGVETKFQIKYK